MKILIIRFSSLGDILLTTPIIRSLREHYPKAQIDFATKKQFYPLLENNPHLDNIITHYKENSSGDCLIKKVRNTKYDLIIDLHKKLSAILLSILSKNRRIIRYKKRHFYRQLLAHPKYFSHLKGIDTTVSLYASVLKKLNISLDDTNLELYPDKEANRTILSKFGIIEDSYKIFISPGATRYTKRYPPELWAEFIDVIPDEWHPEIVLLGDEKDRSICQEIARKTSPKDSALVDKQVKDLSGKTNLQDLISLIDKCDIFLSGDSGPMHIASALHKPQIALFGGTSPKLGFAPVNKKAVILEVELSCRPCSLHGREKCPKGHFQCMYNIKPAKIFSVIEKIRREKAKCMKTDPLGMNILYKQQN